MAIRNGRISVFSPIGLLLRTFVVDDTVRGIKER
jgi:transcription elongation GreA/GreB family factor